MAPNEYRMKVRIWLDEKLAVAWMYHAVDEDPANDKLMDVCLVSKSRQEFMRIGCDGVASRGFEYQWQKTIAQL